MARSVAHARIRLPFRVSLCPGEAAYLSGHQQRAHETRRQIDRGLEFAAGAVKEVLGGPAVVMHRLPAFTPHRKGKMERLNLTTEQT
ncbi:MULTISPECIES: hypothetical protein [Streptomyces]|uniref:Transposase n=1 Tax=Streptomyces mordarskii TaxID=1226758 RepID=A0ABP3N509_9ACTN